MHAKFADHFRQLVIPKLKGIARTQGFFLSLDLVSYHGAHTAVWDVALKLGVTHLRDDMIDDIRAWIDDEIWQAFEAFDADLQEYRRTVSEPVAHDIRQWEWKLRKHLHQQDRDGTCQMMKTA